MEGALLHKEISQILGLYFEEPKANSFSNLLPLRGEFSGHVERPENSERQESAKILDGLMQLLFDLRTNLRTEAKKLEKGNPGVKAMFDQTDLIRRKLAELGVTMEDRAGGTTWKVG